MKGNIFDVKHLAVHDGPGIRTTVFFKGCSLKCIWCHNPEGIYSKPQLGYLAHKCALCRRCEAACKNGVHIFKAGRHELDRIRCILCGKCEGVCRAGALTLYGRQVTADELIPELVSDIDFYECSAGGVTLSGGEPLLQADFCAELLTMLKNRNIHTAVDTCGNVPAEAFDKVLDCTDLFLYDIKHIDSEAHRRLTGAPNERILDNLRYITERGAKTEIRIPLVPACNDGGDVLDRIGRFLGGLKNITRVKILPYHSMARTKYASLDMPDTLPDAAPPSDAALRSAAAIIGRHGLYAVSGQD